MGDYAAVVVSMLSGRADRGSPALRLGGSVTAFSFLWAGLHGKTCCARVLF